MLTLSEQICRHAEPGLFMTSFATGCVREVHLTATALPGETAAELCARTGRALENADATAASITAFDLAAPANVLAWQSPLQESFGDACPLTMVETLAPQPMRRPALEVLAIVAAPLQPIYAGGRAIGNVWQSETLRHCVLGDLRGKNASDAAGDQTQHVFDLMLRALAEADMGFEHVFRTWYRNAEIVRWYAEFNRVRTAFFKAQHVFENLVPASTGIGATNPHGVALIAGLRAAATLDGQRCAVDVPSPLQQPAGNYGSSFSRAAECDLGSHRLLTISGTASINPAGETVFLNDTRRQVGETLRVIEAILRSRSMAWCNTTRALAYFRHPDDMRLLAPALRSLGVPLLPVVNSTQTVCRDNLLFELELDAVA